MAISITIDQKDLQRATAWTKRVQKQLPFATSVALNNVAFDARKSINDGTAGAFHLPVRFTRTAFLVQKSKKRSLFAIVYAQDKAGKDRARYLRFGIAGGSRPPKGFERYFEGKAPNDGTIPRGAYFMPTPKVRTTAAGNVTLATLRKITEGLEGSKRGGFFIGTPAHGGRNANKPPGIYRRSGKQLFRYFTATTDRPDYKPRFNIQQIGQTVVSRRFNQYFTTALTRAIESAR